MFCQNCGVQNPDGVSFCMSCGKPVTQNVVPVVSQPQAPVQQIPMQQQMPVGMSQYPGYVPTSVNYQTPTAADHRLKVNIIGIIGGIIGLIYHRKKPAKPATPTFT